MVKNLPAYAGDMRDKSSIPGSGRFPGRGHGNPLQYSCLATLLQIQPELKSSSRPMIEGENTFLSPLQMLQEPGLLAPSKEMAQVGRKHSSGAVMEGRFLLLRAEVGSSSLNARRLKVVNGIPQSTAPHPPTDPAFASPLCSLLSGCCPLSPLPDKTLTGVTNNHLFSS